MKINVKPGDRSKQVDGDVRANEKKNATTEKLDPQNSDIYLSLNMSVSREKGGDGVYREAMRFRIKPCDGILCDGILCDGILCDAICDAICDVIWCDQVYCDAICDQICDKVCDGIFS